MKTELHYVGDDQSKLETLKKRAKELSGTSASVGLKEMALMRYLIKLQARGTADDMRVFSRILGDHLAMVVECLAQHREPDNRTLFAILLLGEYFDTQGDLSSIAVRFMDALPEQFRAKAEARIDEMLDALDKDMFPELLAASKK